MKISELVKILKSHGCYKERNGSNHNIWVSPVTNKHFQVPRHCAKEVKTGLLNGILKQAGIQKR
nr:MAG TPA: hypothetical protein [Caudoviricetes sp.]